MSSMRSSARRRIQPREDIMQQSLSEVILEKDRIDEKEVPFAMNYLHHCL